MDQNIDIEDSEFLKFRSNNLLKLDIGCGPNKKVGYIGIDILPLEGVDICVDLNNAKLPFDDNSVDEIYLSRFIEHLENTVSLLEEFNSVLKDRGILRIIVPHYTNPYSSHFTHKTYWSSYSFEQEYIDYYLNIKLVLISKKIHTCILKCLDPIFNLFANKFFNLHERFFATFIKAWEIEFILIKNESKKNKILNR